MDLLVVFLLLLALIPAAFYVTRPLATRLRAAPPADRALSALLAERDRVLAALQELDFDYTLGKIPAEEYPVQREALVQRGAQILRMLDERSDRKAAAQAQAPASTDDELERLIARRRAERREKTGVLCPQCGKPVLHSDRFCPQCGHALQ